MEQTKSEWMDKICPQGKEHKIVLNNHGIKVGIERQRYNSDLGRTKFLNIDTII